MIWRALLGLTNDALYNATGLSTVGTVPLGPTYEENANRSTVMDKPLEDALGHVRAAAQELHGAISDAAAKRGATIRGELESAAGKAKALTASVKAINGQNEAAKKYLAEAVRNLEATQKHAAEAIKSSGQALQSTMQQTMTDARAAVQKVSEAVAATRSAKPKK